MSEHQEPLAFQELPEAPAAEIPVLDWHRLDRRMIMVSPLQPLLSVIGVIALVSLVRGWDKVGFWEPAIAVVVAVGLVGAAAWSWATTQYRITPTHVELHSGLVVRKQRSVARDRLRTVDVTADVFHRVFGLSVVKIGTGRQAAGDEDELTLNAITAAEADRLRLMLLRRTRPATAVAQDDSGVETAAEPEQPAESLTLSKLDPRWLRFAPLTLLGLVAVGLLVGGGLQLARTIGLDPFKSGLMQRAWEWLSEAPLVTTILLGAGAVLVLSSLLSVLVYVLLYWNYELTRQDDGTLRVRYGLLTLRSVSIEEERLRGVRMDEPLLLRLGHGARCKAIATGLDTKQDEDKLQLDAGMLLPQSPLAEAHRVTAAVLQVQPAPTTAPLRRHPVAALRRTVFRDVAFFALATIVLAVLAGYGVLPAWAWQLALAVTALSVLYGLDEYRNLGHALTDRYLVTRSGCAIRSTVALQRTGIIGWNIRRTFFQRRAGLLTVSATTAAGGGAFAVRDVGEPEGLALAEAAIPELLTPFLERY